jgi:hypothetical protein
LFMLGPAWQAGPEGKSQALAPGSVHIVCVRGCSQKPRSHHNQALLYTKSFASVSVKCAAPVAWHMVACAWHVASPRAGLSTSRACAGQPHQA